MPASTWLRALSIAQLALDTVDRSSISLVAGYNLLFGAPAATLLSEVLGVPLVVTAFGEIHSHRAVAEAHRAFLQRLAARACLTSITEHCARSFEALGIQADVTVLPYGIDVRRFPGTGGQAHRQQLGIAPDAAVAAFVGRLVPDMGLDTVLAAIPRIQAEVPGSVMMIAGADGSMRQAAEALSDRSGGNVRVITNVPEQDLPLVMAAADVLMLPTAGPRACGSLAAIEAMASARPVVAARVGGIPEIVSDDCAVLVAPGNAEALARAVVQLFRDPSRRIIMGERGRQRAQRMFDRDHTNAAIEAYFRAAIEVTESNPESTRL
jgi:glycosyltransferase involved in cell wall biosynthesis